MKPVVAVRGLSKSYQDGDRAIEVLRQLDVELAPGRSLAVTGPSGSGKSTLMNMLGCLDRPTSGMVKADQTAMNDLLDELEKRHPRGR